MLERIFHKVQKTSFLSQNGDFSLFEIKNQKSGRVTFHQFWCLNFVQNFRKILRAVSEKKRDGTGRTDGTDSISPFGLRPGTNKQLNHNLADLDVKNRERSSSFEI